MIQSFVDDSRPVEALHCYHHMLSVGRLPNNYTFSFLLRACSALRASSDGQKLHTHIIRLGWDSHHFVQNGLIHLYVTCDRVHSARKLFDASLSRDVITWTAMVNGYVKSGDIEAARALFDAMPEKNQVSWSAIINGCAKLGLFEEALHRFIAMQLSGFRPNHAGLVGALTACASLGALDQGRWIHAYIDRNAIVHDRVLGTSLIDMYAKCGCIDAAVQIFDAMPARDVFAWTALISGLSNHGRASDALELYRRMRREGVAPNGVTFVCALSACARMGLVDEGRRIFDGIAAPGVQHYGCLVDLLGRARLIEEAREVVLSMPMEPDSYVLGALLNACGVHGEVDVGEETVRRLAERRLDHDGVRVLMSNMYASAERWDEVAKVREEMEAERVKKVPGYSSIEVDGFVCEFVAGDRSHPLREEIMSMSVLVDKQMSFV
ncbi:Pentatricopeptide repeat-containing protein [Acorus calamus]|uniref:Pentatricopeptide repeat-containing protein n=1 Tax=Acorus calamus TaxID=4465 RepID=A0AAV9FG58_ACOCL|nr:Pentatricopeptide repeat-containing protein [Acorus calamus]